MTPEYLKVSDLVAGLQSCDPNSCVQFGKEIVLAGKAPATLRKRDYPFLITTIDHEVEASYKGALDELREQVIDLCDEYEHEDSCLSVKDFIASLRRIST